MDTEEEKHATGPGTLLRLLLSAALMLGLISWLREDELVTVGLETPLEGRITRCDVNRQHFNWYLNGQPVRYDLWSFVPGDPATRRLRQIAEARFDTTWGYSFYNTLAYYLSTGDQLCKTAGSPLVTVQHADTVTVWQLEPN